MWLIDYISGRKPPIRADFSIKKTLVSILSLFSDHCQLWAHVIWCHEEHDHDGGIHSAYHLTEPQSWLAFPNDTQQCILLWKFSLETWLFQSNASFRLHLGILWGLPNSDSILNPNWLLLRFCKSTVWLLMRWSNFVQRSSAWLTG